MWGNPLGWIISAGLSLALSFLLYIGAMPPKPTPPINAPVLDVARKPIALPVAPDTVVRLGAKPGDAGSLYRKAIEEYQANSDTYAKFSERPTSVSAKQLVVTDLILQARDLKDCTLFQNKLTEAINYDNAEPSLDAIQNAGSICCRLALLNINNKYQGHKPDLALKLWEAAFVLGVHLYDERVSWLEMVDGHGLMAEAAGGLKKYYTEVKKDPKQVAAIDAFVSAEDAYQSSMNDAFKIIGGVDENYCGRYAGDIYAIAVNDKADPMFRVECIKHIGRYRYNSNSIGDQMAANRTLIKLLDDAKATVKAAATAAHDLTIEKFHTFG